jgi:hypothetical protein
MDSGQSDGGVHSRAACGHVHFSSTLLGAVDKIVRVAAKTPSTSCCSSQTNLDERAKSSEDDERCGDAQLDEKDGIDCHPFD